MSTAVKRLLIATVALLAAPCGASAHDVGESNATFFIRPTGIDVELYMGLNAGAILIADGGQFVVITPNTFPDYSDRLQVVASGLFILSGGDGATLQPDAMTVSMTEQTDVLYNLHFPLPTPMPGVLKIRAAYLDKMVETHIGTIYVMNTVGDEYGRGTVTPDSEEIEVRLPGADALVTARSKAPTGAAGAAATAPAVGAIPGVAAAQVRSGAPWFLWATVGGTALIIALVAYRGIARQNMDRKPNH
jgi:hypothetical protein